MNDTARDMMMYDAQKKSVGVAYLLWFFVGYLGGHRFYAGRTGTAIIQLLLSLIGACTAMVGVGLFVIGLVGIWIIVDAFLLAGIVRSYNVSLAGRLS